MCAHVQLRAPSLQSCRYTYRGARPCASQPAHMISRTLPCLCAPALRPSPRPPQRPFPRWRAASMDSCTVELGRGIRRFATMSATRPPNGEHEHALAHKMRRKAMAWSPLWRSAPSGRNRVEQRFLHQNYTSDIQKSYIQRILQACQKSTRTKYKIEYC